jgi:hypothetical protein
MGRNIQDFDSGKTPSASSVQSAFGSSLLTREEATGINKNWFDDIGPLTQRPTTERRRKHVHREAGLNEK